MCRFSCRLWFITLLCAGLTGAGPRAQSPSESTPAAVTQTVFVGCVTCSNAACTLAGIGFCDSVSHNSVTTINAGDSVHFSGVGVVPHSATQGGLNTVNTLTGISPVCVIGSSGTYSACGVTDPNGAPVFSSGAPAAGLNYTFRFDRPGAYPYFCAVHACSNMRGQIIVNPASVPRTGGACQQPLLRHVKVAAGADVTTACGFGAPAGPPLPAAGTVLCWNAQSGTAATPGVTRVLRDTQPNFAAPSANFQELTDPTRQTCAPDYADSDPLPPGKAIFYYRVCDNAACDNG